MGNYNSAATRPPQLLPQQGEDGFMCYLGLCRLSFYARVLRAGCHARTTCQDTLFVNKKKRIVGYIMDYISEDNSGYEKTTAYSLEKKLKPISYFEHNYPEGYCDFFLGVAKNYGGLLWTYWDTLSDPNWKAGQALGYLQPDEDWATDALRRIAIEFSNWVEDANYMGYDTEIQPYVPTD